MHRQFSEELQSIEQDILQASLNKLRKEAAERSAADLSDLSDGYLSPLEDTESISSDIFGAPDGAAEEIARQRKRSLKLSRLDENSELRHQQQRQRQQQLALPLTRQQQQQQQQEFLSGSVGVGRTKARPVTRRSISRELFEERPPTKARPVTRRSVSRELFDVNFSPGGGGLRPRKNMPDLDAIRRQMCERERSVGRDFDAFCMDKGFSTNFAADPDEDADAMDDAYFMRGAWRPGGGGGGGYRIKRPTSHLASHGRSLTQNDFQLHPSSASTRLSSAGRRARELTLGGGGGGFAGGGRFPGSSDDGGGAGGGERGGGGSSLDLRDRGDWRRVSVPERGQDFKSLPRKYNR